MKKKISSLKQTIFRTISIPTLGLFIVLTLTIATSSRIIQRQASGEQRYIVNTIAQESIKYLDRLHNIIDLLYLTLPQLPLEEQIALLNEVREHNPQFDSFYLINREGRVIGVSSESFHLLGLDLSGESYFSHTLSTDEIYLSLPFISLSTGKLSLTMGKTIFKDGELSGIIVGELNLEQLQKATQERQYGEEIVTFIVDTNGTVLAHPAREWVEERRNIKLHPLIKERDMAGLFFTPFYDKLTENWYIGSSLRLTNGWTVAVSQPLLVAGRPFIIFILASLLTLTLSILLIIRLRIYSRREIDSPISLLAEKALNLAKGKYTPLDSEEMGSIEEIISLSDSFNSMALAVEERREALKNELVERTKAERESSELRDILRNIIDSMPSVIIGVDSHGKVTNWNREAENETGVSSGEAYGKAVDELYPLLIPRINRIEEAIEKQEKLTESRVPQESEQEIKYKNISVFPNLFGEDKGAVIRVDDITDNIRLEELMIQSEKMLSVGGLAAGMAHEINNPLAGILQNSDVLIRRLTETLPANIKVAEELSLDLETLNRYLERRSITDIIDNIRTSGLRAAKIVEDMLNFSGSAGIAFSTHRLEGLIDQALELASNDYNLKKGYDFRAVEIIKEYAPSIPPINCQKQKLQQVLLNLFINGAQAMSEKSYKEGEHPRFIIRLYRRLQELFLEIEDNGPGIEDEIRHRVFEPFYTTKAVGTGTGLGLSICYFIITEHHKGRLLLDSTYGEGTKFTIVLPLKRGYTS